MSPEQQAMLVEKRWVIKAKEIRPAIARSIADALTIDASQLRFTDFKVTKELSDLFARQVVARGSVEAIDRSAALEMVAGTLDRLPKAMFLLPSRFDDCGMVSVEVADLKGHLDDLLLSQYEALQLISPDGQAGVSLITQEAVLPFRPRFIKIWYSGGQNTLV